MRCLISTLLVAVLLSPSAAGAAQDSSSALPPARGGNALAVGELRFVAHVAVESRRVWTKTRIGLRSGESVAVRATGQVHFGGGQIARTGPTGIAWGSECAAIAKGQARNSPWPAPGLRCWSLIGKVDSGAPFEIGTGTSFRVTSAGELSLGVNDNYVPDNTGTFIATVTVTSPRTSATNNSALNGHRSEVALLAALLVVVLAFIAGAWRRRARKRRQPRSEDAPLLPTGPAESPATESLVAENISSPLLGAATAAVIAPPQADSIDVNIFDVEFSNGLTLRVGYNHFPDGTVVQWRTTQDNTPVASGSFVAEGGGSTNHFETIPLGVKLNGRETHPDGADVQFDWTINGVPFRYGVRRDPNC